MEMAPTHRARVGGGEGRHMPHLHIADNNPTTRIVVFFTEVGILSLGIRDKGSGSFGFRFIGPVGLNRYV